MLSIYSVKSVMPPCGSLYTQLTYIFSFIYNVTVIHSNKLSIHIDNFCTMSCFISLSTKNATPPPLYLLLTDKVKNF